jgi:hypothetical protein
MTRSFWRGISRTFHASKRAMSVVICNFKEDLPLRFQRKGTAAIRDTADDERLGMARDEALKSQARNLRWNAGMIEARQYTRTAGEPERLSRRLISTCRPYHPYRPCRPYHPYHRLAASEVPSLLRGCPSPTPQSSASARQCWPHSAAHCARLWRDR